ncbi:ATP-dependent RNA helicase DDX3Y-like [Tachypleus tridentatus]|uniref:ATP-dependent RNA helicase DDX3Y-like n=1 Tax=Tachypleus tridentatus TaxID=6853 RepID=UPI003FD30B13
MIRVYLCWAEGTNSKLVFKEWKTFPLLILRKSVASRGLDVPNVKHVINYDPLTYVEEYVHHIGHTRRVGNLGLATSFFKEKNINMLLDLVELMAETKQELPDSLAAVAKEIQTEK